MSYERIDYQEIKSSFLESCYRCCRHKLKDINRGGLGWTEGEHEIGYAYYQFENAYELPIEKLMLEVVTLILWAGRCPEQSEILHRNEIKKILSAHPLDELIKDIAEEECSDLLYDMKLLKLV
ncbi:MULTISPECIES: hypothetical protein [Yersinia]|uniref:hypothetical protein n=1 Tax=Yersinia TaxID=629 RepID=UPI0009B70AD8|nr:MULTISPECIES: hypothetical protein [Yersinia]ARB82704.1 hypothetical protein A6J67_00365 [Yersinia sp. FDAARGOS_228]AVL36435.1 hypothetical protein CEQ36_13035 [Yersinia intermedia]